MKCVTCKVNDAQFFPQFGHVACKDCRKKSKEITDRTFEFMPEHVKEERISHKEHTIQPFRDGQYSKEYHDLYGSSRVQVTEEEIKNAKNVWDRDLPGDFYKK